MIDKLIPNNENINKIMDIWLTATISAHPFISKEFWLKNYDVVKDVYIPMSQTYVFSEHGVITGFISILNDEFIGALFVGIYDQGKGIGRSLLTYVTERYKELSLAVYKENEKAVEFYKHMGFVIERTQENEETGEVEYVMSNLSTR